MNNEFTLDSPPIYNPQILRKIPKRLKEDSEILISIFGHPKGFDILYCHLFRSEKKILIFDATSYGHKAKMDAKKLRGARYAMLNAQQVVLLKELRSLNIRVRGYRPTYTDKKCDVMRKACLDKNVIVYEKSNLVEPLNVYNTPGDYTFTIIPAFEALANLIHSLIRY